MDPSTDYIHCDSSVSCPKCGSENYNCHQTGPICYVCGKDVAKICDVQETVSFKIIVSHSIVYSILSKALCHICRNFQMISPRFAMVCSKCLFKYDWVPRRTHSRNIWTPWYETWSREHNAPPLNTGLRIEGNECTNL